MKWTRYQFIYHSVEHNYLTVHVDNVLNVILCANMTSNELCLARIPTKNRSIAKDCIECLKCNPNRHELDFRL